MSRRASVDNGRARRSHRRRHGRTQILRRLLGVALVTVLAAVAPALPVASAAPGQATCTRPVSNAEGLFILAGYRRGYVWDHTDLTVAIVNLPGSDPAYAAVNRQAVSAWDAVLDQCLGGTVSLTYVTGRSVARADIVLRYERHGGSKIAGQTNCSPAGCENVLLHSDPAPGWTAPQGPYEVRFPLDKWKMLVMHELGHALGLGHATNLDSTDLMGYGWLGPTSPDAVLSQCDVDTLAYTWSWALVHTAPTPPVASVVSCP